jgi:hypothetical protein
MRPSPATSSALAKSKSFAESGTRSCTGSLSYMLRRDGSCRTTPSRHGTHFHPFELWIGIGVGEVTEPHRKPVNEFAGGEAFERAREAMNKLKAKRSKTGALTSFVTGDEMFDLIGNTVYNLHDSLLRSISTKQWETITVLMETNGQELAARKLRLNKSTVSRNLRRAFWWQIQETQVAMERIIEAHFPVAR